MALPLIPIAISAGGFLLRAIPSLLRGAFWTVKQPLTNPVRTALGVGLAHSATDGASTRALLATGETVAGAAGAILGEKQVAAARDAAIDGLGKAGSGLAGAGATVVDRYGADTVSAVTSNLPIGRLGLAKVSLNHGAGEEKDVLKLGDIKVPDGLRPSGNFPEKIKDKMGDLDVPFGGLFSKEELAQWGMLAKQEAANNRFIQAGLLLGGMNGLMSGNGAIGKGFHASKNALFMAVLFGAIGHFLFGQNSALIGAATKSVTNFFGKTPNSNASAPYTPQLNAQTSTPYMPSIAPQPEKPKTQPGAAMAPVLSMG